MTPHMAKHKYTGSFVLFTVTQKEKGIIIKNKTYFIDSS